MSITKNVPLNWYSSMKKKIEKDSDNFWHKKLTLKVRNWQFSITWFRAGVHLPEYSFYEKVLFFTQLSYHLVCKQLKKSYMLSNVHCTYYFFWLELISCFIYLSVFISLLRAELFFSWYGNRLRNPFL